MRRPRVANPQFLIADQLTLFFDITSRAMSDKRIEVLDYSLVWLDRDPELVFQERHYLEYSDGIKYSGRHQCSSVG